MKLAKLRKVGNPALAARAQMGQGRVPQVQPGRSRTTQVVALLKSQLQIGTPSVWREVVFSQEIDQLLADIALTSTVPSVAELAARTIGRIHSLTAVQAIAGEQRRNTPGALRALALVRDEAPSLPPIVSRQGRLYAWLANTWRRATDDPIQIVRRFLWALLGAFLAIGLNTYATFRSEDIFAPARWKVTISVGLVTAILIAFVALLADELSCRLRGFWPTWARLLLSGLLAAM